MLKLILVRHGETDSNKKGTYLGWTDVGLNEAGVMHAYAAKKKLEGENIDAVYASPLNRAYKTAEIINENFGLDIICENSLMERNFGIWDNLNHAEITEKYPMEYEEYTRDWINYCVKDGESSMQAYKRITNFINILLSEKKNGCVLIVTHLGCIRKVIAHLLGMAIEGSWRFKIDNGGITKIEVNDEGYAYLTLLNG